MPTQTSRRIGHSTVWAALSVPLLAASLLAGAGARGAEAPALRSPGSAALARQFEAALDRIQRNGNSPGPHAPVILPATAANAYFAQRALLPAAIRGLRLSSSPGVIRGTAEIDFSRLPRGGASGLAQMIFSGVHQVSAVAHLDSGAAPEAYITIQQVRLDGAQIPNFLIAIAIREFVTPKYPQIQGRTFPIALPPRVRSVSVGSDRATLRY